MEANSINQISTRIRRQLNPSGNGSCAKWEKHLKPRSIDKLKAQKYLRIYYMEKSPVYHRHANKDLYVKKSSSIPWRTRPFKAHWWYCEVMALIIFERSESNLLFWQSSPSPDTTALSFNTVGAISKQFNRTNRTASTADNGPMRMKIAQIIDHTKTRWYLTRKKCNDSVISATGQQMNVATEKIPRDGLITLNWRCLKPSRLTTQQHF